MVNKLKVVFLSDDFPPESFGGAGISSYDLAIGVKEAGHDVSVITTCREAGAAGRIEYNGLTIYKIHSKYKARWRSYRSLYNPGPLREVKRIFSDIKPDVVHSNNIHYYLSYHVLKLAKQFAKAVIFTARDTMSFSYGKVETLRYLNNFDAHLSWRDQLKQAKKRWNPLRNFFIKRYLGYADKILAVSEALANSMRQNGINNVEVLHTGADTSAWQVSEDDTIRFKEQHKLSGKKVILFGGRLSEGKGASKVLDAMSTVTKEVPEAALMVMGPSDAYTQIMKDKAKRLGIEDKLIFTGWVGRDDIKYAYGAADVVLVPSVYLDAFPRAAIEGSTAGKPVIATCYGGIHEIIKDGVTGYVIDPRDVTQISDKIVDLLVSQPKAEQFGQAGQMRVATNFNLKDKINELIKYYEILGN